MSLKPYYEDENCVLYHGDSREVLPLLPSNSIDLIVTDPPYGVNWQGRGDHKLIEGDDGSLDVPAVLVQASKPLRRGRHIYVFGGPELVSAPYTATAQLVWDKTIVGLGDLSIPWSTNHEYITFASYELSKANREKGFGRLSARLRQGSVLRVQRTQGGASIKHPTEKPVELLRRLIESSSCMGEIVLDPFVGVGSTMVAAKLEGRAAVGIEIDEGYCKVAAERLAKLASIFKGVKF